MKKFFFVLMAMIIVGINAYSQTTASRDSQWDFFKNVIPLHKITISGSSECYSPYTHSSLRNASPNKIGDMRWEMTFDNNYTVSFTGSLRSSVIHPIMIRTPSEVGTDGQSENYRVSQHEINCSGSGFVVWDNDKMKLMLTINTSSNASGIYRWNWFEKGRNRSNGEEPASASGYSSVNVNFDLQVDNSTNQFQLSQNRIETYVSGDFHETYYFTIGGSRYNGTMTKKSASELNLSSKDEFGEWQWNEGRTRLFLKSRTSDNKFVILNNNGNLSWCMEMVKDAKGSSESTTETKDRIVNLAIAFDGTPAQNYSFVVNNDALSDKNFIQLEYIVQNRFLGTMDRNSKTVLNEIKEKQMLILTYTVNNAQRTDMFLLDGLKNILEHLK